MYMVKVKIFFSSHSFSNITVAFLSFFFLKSPNYKYPSFGAYFEERSVFSVLTNSSKITWRGDRGVGNKSNQIYHTAM